jgi:hypothetical protein
MRSAVCTKRGEVCRELDPSLWRVILPIGLLTLWNAMHELCLVSSKGVACIRRGLGCGTLHAFIR